MPPFLPLHQRFQIPQLMMNSSSIKHEPSYRSPNPIILFFLAFREEEGRIQLSAVDHNLCIVTSTQQGKQWSGGGLGGYSKSRGNIVEQQQSRTETINKEE